MLVVSLPFRSLYNISLFFFNDTATTEIYTLSLHDALPIYSVVGAHCRTTKKALRLSRRRIASPPLRDRKSTRLNSSHSQISYAVFCLKKKKKQKLNNTLYTTLTHKYQLTQQCHHNS